jgi:large subunit ribosomal protein L29
MKASEMRSKSPEELLEMWVTLNRERFNLKMQKATGQLSKPDRIAGTRKEIARVLTVLSEKGVWR